MPWLFVGFASFSSGSGSSANSSSNRQQQHQEQHWLCEGSGAISVAAAAAVVAAFMSKRRIACHRRLLASCAISSSARPQRLDVFDSLFRWLCLLRAAGGVGQLSTRVRLGSIGLGAFSCSPSSQRCMLFLRGGRLKSPSKRCSPQG